MQTRWASGSGRPGDDRTFAAARVLGFEAGAEPMSRANAEGVAEPLLYGGDITLPCSDNDSGW